jgi:hypothetical protein
VTRVRPIGARRGYHPRLVSIESAPVRGLRALKSMCALAALLSSPSCGGEPSTAGDGATEPSPEDSSGGTTEAVDPCDQDADEVRAIACGGEDCDDENPEIHPGAVDDSWARETIDIDLLGGAIVSELSRTEDGTLHAIYTDGSEAAPVSLRHAVKSGSGAWSTEDIVSGDAFDPPTVEVAGDGSIHVVVSVTEAGAAMVRHGAYAGGAWAFEDVGPGRVVPSALAIGQDGVLHVAVTDDVTSWWRGDGNGWTSEPVGPLESAIVVLGDGDVPDVIGREGTTLRACTRGDTEWTCSDVTPVGDPGAYGARNRGTYDGSGVLHLVSVDAVDTERLVHRRRIDGVWSTTMLSFLPRPEHGLDVVWDGEVLHVVAWTEALVEGGAGYARWSDEAWSLDEPVVAGNNVGWEPAMIVDPSGVPHVVYADVLVDDLHYAARTAGDGIDQDCDGIDG